LKASPTSFHAAVRAGRANPAVLYPHTGGVLRHPHSHTADRLRVRSGSRAPWSSSPGTASALKLIEKAILASDLGINPQNDGRVIRLVFPQLTEERRKELAKQVKKYGEEAKVAVRNIRRDAMEKYKKQQKASEITEDDYKNIEKDVQKLTDDYIKKVDDVTDKKDKELFAI
jgi:ribosome recycling factor